MADTIKCPNCSANLTFDADKQMLVCDFCGGEFLPTDEAISDQSKKLYSEDITEEREVIVENPDVAESEAFARGMADEPVIEYDPESMHELVCNSCGATVVADRNTSATYCAFCGSPAIVSQRLSSEFTPKYIIPFQYSRDKAIEKFFKWCKGGRFTPIGFTSNKNIEKLTGLYVPFWLFDLNGQMDIAASAQTVSSVTTGSKTVTTTKYYDVKRRGKIRWRRIPLDGATRIDDTLMEAIEPFDYRGIKRYNPAYLPGFFADKYDLSAEDLRERINKRAFEYINQEFKKSTSQYQSVKINTQNNSVSEFHAEYALLPVYFMNYKYQGNTYTFCMNGQTGEVAGIMPISNIKRIVFFFLCLGIGAVIMRLITALILGGIAG